MDAAMARDRSNRTKKVISKKEAARVLNPCLKNSEHFCDVEKGAGKKHDDASTTRETVVDGAQNDKIYSRSKNFALPDVVTIKELMVGTNASDAFSYFISAHPFPQVDKGGLVARARERQLEKTVIDKEVHDFLENESKERHDRKLCNLNQRLEEEKRMTDLKAEERMRRTLNIEKERTQVAEHIQMIAKREESRKKNEVHLRHLQAEHWKQDCLMKTEEKKCFAKSNRSEELKARVANTRMLVKDLIEEHEYSQQRKKAEMDLRREQLETRKEVLEKQSREDQASKFIERKVCEMAEQQYEEAEKNVRKYYMNEGKTRRLALIQQQAEDKERMKKEALARAEVCLSFTNRPETPVRRRGKFCPPSILRAPNIDI